MGRAECKRMVVKFDYQGVQLPLIPIELFDQNSIRNLYAIINIKYIVHYLINK